MGEKQIRAQAERLGTEALRSQFDALGDLAVAADAANKADELRKAARIKAQQIIDEAEAEVVRRADRWRQAWQNACAAGWTVKKLRAASQPPPAAPKAKRRVGRRSRSPAGGGEATSGPRDHIEVSAAEPIRLTE